MVFESIITDVLNRVLGSYIENLDSKQLKLGIWGGDVVLKDLLLKPSALDDLNLPVQIVYGRLGQLVLKIPWKNLYGAAVEASVEGLYLLIVPNQQVKYDEEKERNILKKNKESELQKIEDIKKKEAEKDQPKPDDTFAEKLTMQIIKNVQVKIQNIHLRYEDKVTHAKHPFAMGVTLSNLCLQTTDEKWTPTIVQETVTKFFKVLSLEGLAAYWNCGSVLYAHLPVVDLIDHFRKEIATKSLIPPTYKYILGPIYAAARLRLNPKPDCDTPVYTIPKVHLNLEMEKLHIGINKSQYRDIIALADSMDRMSKGVPYRKYRPDLTEYKKHYTKWWHFAYNCVLDDVRRRRRNWNWDHMKAHREMCKKYANVFRTKLTQKKIPADVQEKLDLYEQELDIFNIVVVRQRIHLDVARLGKLQALTESKSWFSSWWGGGSKQTSDTPSEDLVKQLEDAMTPDEKARLYDAIGYQENSAPLHFPEAYIDNSCMFILRLLEIQVEDDSCEIPRVLNTELVGVKCRIETRAAAAALKVAVAVDTFSVFGVEQDELVPELITTVVQAGEGDALLDVLFETNPLDKLCDQRVHIKAKPIKVVYDAATINKIVNIFSAPQSSALEQLSVAAGNGLTNFKEMSAVGLQHAIDKHSIIDLKVDLCAPYVVIPYGGLYTGVENVLVINLGHIRVASLDHRGGQNVSKLHAKGHDGGKILEQMITQSYDEFELQFSQLQILLVQGGEDWFKIMSETTVTPSHILSPLNLNLNFYKCLITDDPRLPLAKVRGNLPSIAVYISDVRLLLLIALVTSIPLPDENLPENKPLTKSSRSHTSSQSLMKLLELEEKVKRKSILESYLPEDKHFKGDLIQFTNMDVKFVMESLSVVVNKQETSASPVEEMLNLNISLLELDFIQQTFNTDVGMRLGTIDCSQMRETTKIAIINTPTEIKNEYFISVKFQQVNKASPEFHSKHQSCEARLILDFSKLNVTLHQEGILALLKFATDLQSQIEDVTAAVSDLPSHSLVRMQRLPSVAESFIADIKSSKTASTLLNVQKKKKTAVIETIQFKLNANLDELSILFACNKNNIGTCAIRGISAEVIVKASYTQVVASLNLITVTDLNPKSIHSKILTVTSDEVAKVQVVMYNEEHKSPDNIDISVQLSLGCLRFVFLNWFITNMLNFLNNFQNAEQAIIEASQNAVEAARQNVHNAYQNSTRISLNIDLKAPVIIVPVSSQSYDALLIDLGYLTIINKFNTLEVKSEHGECAVLDEMKLKLIDLTIARVRLDNENNTIRKISLLEPVTFILSIKRNLSTAWYKSVADIDLSGKLNTVTVLLAQTDFKMIMSILELNLGEGQAEQPPPPPPKPESSIIVQKSGETVVTIEEKGTDLKVHTLIKFTLTMESFIINLFLKGPKQDTLSPVHDPKDALARFSLEVLSIKGRILSDNSIAASILLVNCLLDDTRKGRAGKLNRLMERKGDLTQVDQASHSTSTESLEPIRSMIDVTVQLKDRDMFVDVRIFSFTIILSVDYLLKVAEFFTSSVTPANQPTQPVKAPVKDIQSSKSSTSARNSTLEKSEDTTITLNLRVEKPDIILVEHMDNIDTNALILNNEIMLKVRISGAHQVINGSISDIHLYTCCYNPAKRNETKNSVILPVSISIAGSTPEGQGLHIEVCVTNVCICVSPSTIELLSKVSQTMSSNAVLECESECTLEDYSNTWEAACFTEQNFWFLKAEVAEDAVKLIDADVLDVKGVKLTELCIVSMPSLIITVEAGVGNKTLPMLLLDSSFSGTVHDWSSQLYIDASLTLQMGYYNSTLAVWEPVIETVEVTRDNKITYEPWALKLEVSKADNEIPPSSPTDDEEEEFIQIQPANMTIDVSSTSNLELTVTKTSLEVLKNLGKAFSSAMNTGLPKVSEVTAPYVVKNDSGLRVKLRLANGAFKMYGQKDDLTDVVLEIGASAPLQLKPSLELSKGAQLGKELLISSLKTANRFLNVEIIDLIDCRLELPVIRSDKRYFLLNHRDQNNDSWGIISAVTVDEGVTSVTLRSIIQVHNHFRTPVDVYYMTVRGNELECISSIEPGTSINIPLNAVYTPTNELFFSVPGYSVTNTPFIWKDLKLNLSITKMMQCTPKNNKDNNEPFIIKVVGETEQIYHENTNRHTMASTCYNIHLHPAVAFKNCLPIDVICCVQNIAEEQLVKPGESLHMPNVNPGSSQIVLRLPDYLEKEWSSQQEVLVNPPAFAVWQFDSFDSAHKVTLDLGMHSLTKGGSMVMILYCPFWMLNKTGLLISYRPANENLNVLYHPPTFKGPVLFSFNAKNFFGKKKASVRVEQGEWSDKFSLDVAGSSGYIGCKTNNIIYQIGVNNQLTYNGLTKQVTFTPYYVVINNANFPLECQEFDRPADSWIRVEANACVPLWPRSERDDKLLKLRVVNTREVSAPFLYTEMHNTLLKLQNKYGGVNVDIQITEGGIYVNLFAYEQGMAPALIINHTEDTMCIWEKETVQLRKLNPGCKMLYAWENPSGPKILVWDIGHKKELEDDLRKDGVGEFSPIDDVQVYWVSFLDGMQRILLFTLDKVVAENVQCAKQFEAIDQEINVLIHGLGLSLVNNVSRQEILYIGIASSGITWETCKLHSRRFKEMSIRESLLIESAYQNYLNQRHLSSTSSGHVIVDSKTEIDFESGFMLRPNKRRIRRTFQTGLWFQMKSSSHQLQLHAKVNRLQIDNQMIDSIFPVVLAPVPPPKSVAGDVQKPFAELSIVERLIKYSQIRQLKYFKVLIQEFHVKVDLGFVNAVVELLQDAEYSEYEERELFLLDAKLVDEPLLSHVASKSLQEQKNFYDLLHFSPLKVHVSFSLQAAGGSPQGTPNFLNVLLQGLGVTLTDMQDVVFRLAYFEREYTFLTQRQLISEATAHYVGQAVKQLYVLVLGLDVLGNPYGLVIGITKGVEDLFYEPFQGAIQGPGEFAEGLVLGVRSLFGHTVGGAAGAVSRITGALGKGIAALTFDDEYQHKRRDQIKKRPATVQEGIARGGKGLVMGVVDGVTGVFTKPISGAKDQGIEGFFKGLGKGAVGLVARPTAGVIDFASGSLDAVKRCTELGEETIRLRPPRFIPADGLVRHYNLNYAVGHKILVELEKGKYAHTDIYIAHFFIVMKKEVLLLTDKRLAYITHSDLFGGWQVEWSYTWQEIKPPVIVAKGISIGTNEPKKKKLGIFGSSDSGKIIIVGDPALREEICSKIEDQLKNI